MCYYRTYKDGRLVTNNVEVARVELLYKIKSFVAYLDVPKLSVFIAEAEQKLFEEEGRHFKEWLASMNPEGVEELLALEELHHSRSDDERRNKQCVRQFLKEFLTP